MRYAEERKLAADIKNQLLKPLYLLVGEEAFLKVAYRSRLIEAALGGEASGFNLAVFGGAKLDFSALTDAVTTLPLMAGRRCVVVDDFAPEKVNEADRGRFAELFSQIPKETILIMVQTGPPETDKKKAAEVFYKLVDDAGGAVVTLDARKGNDLVHFVVRRVEEGGARISLDAAGYLIAAVGEDMARLGTECDKLAAYAGAGGEVTAAAVDTLTPATVEADVYRLARHIVAGDLDKALRLVDALDYLKTPVGLVMATLSGAFADLYRAKVAAEKGVGESGMAKDFAYRHSFRVKNALRDARHLKRAHIEAAALAILDCDSAMKSTGGDDRQLLEQAVVRAAAALRGEVFH